MPASNCVPESAGARDGVPTDADGCSCGFSPPVETVGNEGRPFADARGSVSRVVASCAEESGLKEPRSFVCPPALPLIGGPLVSVEAQAEVRIAMAPSISANVELLIIASLTLFLIVRASGEPTKGAGQ